MPLYGSDHSVPTVSEALVLGDHVLCVAKKLASLVHSEHEVDRWTPSQGFIEYWLVVGLSGPHASLNTLLYACLHKRKDVSALYGPRQSGRTSDTDMIDGLEDKEARSFL
jgi:hypothetical protein